MAPGAGELTVVRVAALALLAVALTVFVQAKPEIVEIGPFRAQLPSAAQLFAEPEPLDTVDKWYSLPGIHLHFEYGLYGGLPSNVGVHDYEAGSLWIAGEHRSLVAYTAIRPSGRKRYCIATEVGGAPRVPGSLTVRACVLARRDLEAVRRIFRSIAVAEQAGQLPARP